MSETSNDMERDKKLAALYRAAAHDEPPPALDDAIRAAARRAVASKPRSAGASFIRWRVPLSIAAMVVLSVSLVTLMVEEAPELAQPPRADMPGSPAELERKPAEPAPIPGPSPSMIPKTVAPDAKDGGSVGLKPPQQAAPPAIGLRSNTGAPAAVAGLRKEAAAGRDDDSVPSRPMRREPPEAFPGSDESRGQAAGGIAGKPERQAAEEESRERDSRFAQAPRAEQVPPPPSASAPATPPAAVAELKSASKSETASADNAAREQPRARMQAAPAPAAKRAPSASAADAYANVPPEKWLEQIETLRKQGRTDEARASFAEFRRRYPDYPLPDAVKEWAQP